MSWLQPLPEPKKESPAFGHGDVLAGRFRVERFLASGGMGEIYEAEDLELGGRVALKTIRAHVASDERVMRRFRREVRLARMVTHPNVCRIFEAFTHASTTRPERSDITFVTMELLEGDTLARRLEQVGHLSVEDAWPLVCQMANALEAAHAAGVIHRDFKTANVLLVPGNQGERAVVTDFGLARLDAAVSSKEMPLTETIGITGTPAYMAPEQLEGGEITTATDVFAMGVVIYELVTGACPFQGETLLATALARLRQDPLPPRAYMPGLPTRWNQAILRCLAREPSDRFSGPRELVEYLEVETGTGTVEVGGDELAPSGPSERTIYWLGALLALMTGLLVYLLLL